MPQNVEVHLIVAMDQPIAEAHDLVPWNLGSLGAFDRIDSGSGFADDFKKSDEREVEQSIAVQVAAGLASGQVDGLLAVTRASAEARSAGHGATYWGSASFRTLARK